MVVAVRARTQVIPAAALAGSLCLPHGLCGLGWVTLKETLVPARPVLWVHVRTHDHVPETRGRF